MKNIKNKKTSGLLNAFLTFLLIFTIVPSTLALSENEYPYDYLLSLCEVEDGDLSDVTSINGIPFHLTPEPWAAAIKVYFFFDHPSLNNVESILKLVYDFTHGYQPSFWKLSLLVHYYGETYPDSFTLYPGPWIDPPEYQTVNLPLRPNKHVYYLEFTLWAAIDLWFDFIRVRYTYVSGGGGGGGCPILSVFDGEVYQEEGLLDIHDSDGNDVTYQHTLINSPKAVDNRYHLKLTEHPKTISDIDQVELYGILPSNQRIRLPLISAIHCEDGQVSSLLRKSDDKKAEVLGADYNNGVSQYIDLEFVAPKGLHFTDFVFVIEGNNAFEK